MTSNFQQYGRAVTAYYNEIDPYAAQWLRNLIAAGHIAPGEVDERSLLDVCPDDLAGFTQCHFFAGIGVWSYALRQGGWPDSRPVWTGSCPCQPFSVAGVGGGLDDERHLWPFWFHLIEQCRPPVVFGEQVEAAIKHGWLDLVQADMEGIGYAFAAAGIPAAGVGAPHIRQRLWFVADSVSAGWSERRPVAGSGSLAGSSGLGELADDESQRCGEARRVGAEPAQRPADGGAARGMADADSEQHYRGWNIGARGRDEHPVGGAACGLAYAVSDEEHEKQQRPAEAKRGGCSDEPGGRGMDDTSIDSGPTNGFWRNADWLLCRDGKWRPVEPGTFPLAHGAAARVGRLRAYGNAISPFPASEMIAAYLECRP